MKLNAKGFTLIELLAVIVILAIIALIATPIVLGILEDARKSAAKDSAYGIIKAAELEFAKSLVGSTTTIVADGAADNLTKVNYSGTPASAGKLTISSAGVVTITDVTFNGYKCNGGSSVTVTCTK